MNNLHPTIEFIEGPPKFDNGKTLLERFLDIIFSNENGYEERDIFYKEKSPHDYLDIVRKAVPATSF